MSVERAFVKYQVYRGNTEAQSLTMRHREGSGGAITDTDIAATYADVKIQVRQSQDPDSKLIKTLSIEDGTISIVNTNVLSFDLKLDNSAGTYFYDVLFKFIGGQTYLTYIQGPLIITNNVTRK